MHPHALQHTVAHVDRSNRGGDDEVMRLVGWTSREMLSRYGASFSAEQSRELHDNFSPRRGL